MTPRKPARFRAGVRVVALCGLVVAVLVGGGLALAAWSTVVHERAGEICGSAWHYHPGSGFLPHGGEMGEAQRHAIGERCDEAGGGPWRAGWLALGSGGAAAVVCAGVLVATRSRRKEL